VASVATSAAARLTPFAPVAGLCGPRRRPGTGSLSASARATKDRVGVINFCSTGPLVSDQRAARTGWRVPPRSGLLASGRCPPLGGRLYRTDGQKGLVQVRGALPRGCGRRSLPRQGSRLQPFPAASRFRLWRLHGMPDHLHPRASHGSVREHFYLLSGSPQAAEGKPVFCCRHGAGPVSTTAWERNRGNALRPAWLAAIVRLASCRHSPSLTARRVTPRTPEIPSLACRTGGTRQLAGR
jgi:hypothetical protein